MPKHPFDIQPNGDVLYNGTLYFRTAVEALIRQLKPKLENYQSEAVGHYLGYVVALEGKSYSHLKIGCESFDTRTIQAFIEDYENRPSVLHVCLGDRVIRKYEEAEQEYIVARAGYDQVQLTRLSDGNRWDEPVTRTRPSEPIPLIKLVGEEHINDFSIKEK